MTPVPPVLAATLASTLATQADRLAAYVISLGATPTEAEEVVQEVAVVAAATATEPAQPWPGW